GSEEQCLPPIAGDVPLGNNPAGELECIWVGPKRIERLRASRGSRCTGQQGTRQPTLRRERSSALKEHLTGPTLLEMSGYGSVYEAREFYPHISRERTRNRTILNCAA